LMIIDFFFFEAQIRMIFDGWMNQYWNNDAEFSDLHRNS